MKQSTRKCCGYANKYKVIRKPTCGCELCTFLWEVKHETEEEATNHLY